MGPQTGRTSESFIRATGQSWKMAAGVVLFGVAVIAAAVFHLGPDQARSPSRTIEAVAGLLACASVWWIRCPACRRSVGFWSFKQVVGKFGPADLPLVPQCPYCSPTQQRGNRGS